MSFINTGKHAKKMVAVGAVFFIAAPQYAYYWKRQQMGTFEKGVEKDTETLKVKGKTRADVPRRTQYTRDKFIGPDEKELFQEKI